MIRNENAVEADYRAEQLVARSANQQARGLAIFWEGIRAPTTIRQLEDSLEVALELLVAVYQRAGNHRPAKQRHLFPPGIRDATRDLLKEAGMIEEANEIPDDWEGGTES